MKYSLLFAFLFTQIICFSSPRITVKKEYENVILFYDGNTNNEKYAKLEFIAKRVLILSKQYNYSEKIILNFLFLESNDERRDYFIAYTQPKYLLKHKNYKKFHEEKLIIDNNNFIVLTAFDEFLSQMETLKLIDFALYDLKSFKNLQIQEIKYERFDNEYNYIYSISEDKVQRIIENNKASYFVRKTMSEKIYREVDNKDYTFFISYFTMNDKYYPYLRERKNETVIDTLDKIKYYAREFNNVFVFSDSFVFNFYAFEDMGNELIIKKNIRYNNNTNTSYTYISVHEILKGVYMIKYYIEPHTIESSLFTINKGMIEKELSKYEYRPKIGF